MSWIIYGANGYTGELIAREAVARGHTPIVAGRSHTPIAALADEIGVPYRVFLLEGDLSERIGDVDLVLHCAGPFSATAEPMMRACVATSTHYLDITGEIDVFELAQRLGPQAQQAGSVLCPGVGFDVIPTDCIAATLGQRLPDATDLALGFDSRSGLSRGTAKTTIEGLSKGGRVRRDGDLTRVPLAWRTRRIDFGDGEKFAMTIPWGDVATAFHTTGIPNIEVYVATSPGQVRQLRRLNLIRPVLGLGPVQAFLKRQVDKRVQGPGAEQRKSTDMYVWGEAGNGREIVSARLRTANGYDVTVNGALGVVEHVMNARPAGGAYTPSQLMGADFAASLPGSGALVLS